MTERGPGLPRIALANVCGAVVAVGGLLLVGLVGEPEPGWAGLLVGAVLIYHPWLSLGPALLVGGLLRGRRGAWLGSSVASVLPTFVLATPYMAQLRETRENLAAQTGTPVQLVDFAAGPALYAPVVTGAASALGVLGASLWVGRRRDPSRPQPP